MNTRLQGAPTVPVDGERTATLASVQYVGLGPRPTLTLWTRNRVTWDSWQAFWNRGAKPR